MSFINSLGSPSLSLPLEISSNVVSSVQGGFPVIVPVLSVILFILLDPLPDVVSPPRLYRLLFPVQLGRQLLQTTSGNIETACTIVTEMFQYNIH